MRGVLQIGNQGQLGRGILTKGLNPNGGPPEVRVRDARDSGKSEQEAE